MSTPAAKLNRPAISAGRPPFLSSQQFREYLSRTDLKRAARVDGIEPFSFLARCEREGRPIPHRLHHGQKRWRLLDIVARARADGVTITEPPSPPVVDAAEFELRRIMHALPRRLDRSAFGASPTGPKKRRMPAEPEIVAASQAVGSCVGVYFLVENMRVVYVGQSLNVHGRVATHATERRKHFDRYAYIQCDRSELDVLESLYIYSLRPLYNVDSDGHLQAPLTAEQLMRRATRNAED